MLSTFFIPNLLGQSSDKMSYQAVVRNATNELVSNQTIGMKISVLQGLVSGTAVYEETQTPDSNMNGLISIEIGSGNVNSGDFSSINWENGPYFIKTEIDLDGGVNYTIVGTSQLLSVPYAFHTKTAETLTGELLETDPVFASSVASGITEEDISNWDNKQDELTAGEGIDITDNIISTTENNVTYSVGDFAQGGVVFWVDETGQHGLVAAIEDQNNGEAIQWSNGNVNLVTGAQRNGIYAGEMNTTLIIAELGFYLSNYAAGVCANYTYTMNEVTYGDWYLPSHEELRLMYLNKEAINTTSVENGGAEILPHYYWSSTEHNTSFAAAWILQMGTGNLNATDLKSYQWRVRAVRKF